MSIEKICQDNCCGKSESWTGPQKIRNLFTMLCAIVENTAGGGGSSTASQYVWEECFQYLPDGEDELVSFTRRFTEDLLTNVVTTYDYDKLTGDPVVVPEGATLSICPSCCDTTNELLTTSATSYLTNPFIPLSFAQTDMTVDTELLPPPGVGFRYEIRYLSYNNESATPANFEFTGDVGMYTNYFPQFGTFATRFNKDDYLVLGDHVSLSLTGSDSTNATVEYRIIPV